MFEVYSYGALPYNRNWKNSQILEALETGYRLERPAGCPQFMYVLYEFQEINHSWNEVLFNITLLSYPSVL